MTLGLTGNRKAVKFFICYFALNLGFFHFYFSESWNPSKNSFEEMMQTVTCIVDIVSMNPKCQINGIILIYDLSDLTLKHVSELIWNNRLWTVLSLGQVRTDNLLCVFLCNV